MKRVFSFFKNPFVHRIILFLTVILVYAGSLANGFVSDDRGLISDASSWNIWSFYTGTVFHLQTILWLFLYKTFGLVPWPYRMMNIFFHAGVSILLYGIILRLFEIRKKEDSKSTWLALAASLFFAVHPLAVESVAWISGGIYILYTFFFLLSFKLYMQKKTTKVTMVFSVISYTLSLLFSEKASILFLFFPLYEFCFGSLKKHWKKIIPYFTVSILFICFYIFQISFRIQGVVASSYGSVKGLYVFWHQVPAALTEYGRLFFWPNTLTLYHSDLVFNTGEIALRIGIALLFLIVLGISFFRNKTIAFFGSWIVIPLLPTLTPLPIAWIVAERYCYLSLAGMCTLFVLFISWCFGLIRISDVKNHMLYNVVRAGASVLCFILFIGVFSLLIVRTEHRIADWHNEDTLWAATVLVSPGSYNAWNNMGDVYARHGDMERAVRSFEQAIVRNPRYADAYHNLGETYRDMGQTGDAILMYEKALEYNPGLWQSHVSLAAIAFEKKDYHEALSHLLEAQTISPDTLLIEKNISVVKQTMGE